MRHGQNGEEQDSLFCQPAIDPLNANGEIPRRQCYPTTEKDLNSAELCNGTYGAGAG